MILRRMAQTLEDHQCELCELEALDTGIPLTQIKSNHIPAAIETLNYYSNLIATTAMSGRIWDTPTTSSSSENSQSAHSLVYTRREPLGVCVGLGSWNYPLAGMIAKVAPALACGNTMIFKPSECTPLTAWRAVQLWHEASCLPEYPSSVLQILQGDASVGQQLTSDYRVQHISLTGSHPTGKSVMASAAVSPTWKRITLELGGKSALIVFDDADMESVIRVMVDGNFLNNGQVCSNCTRVLIQKSCWEEVIERLLTYIQQPNRIIMGNNMELSTTIGPLIKHPKHPSQHFKKVQGMIERAKSDPLVTLLWGGQCYESQENAYFVEPTIFATHSPHVEIAQEEVFGPVMTLIPFEEADEAVQIANNTPYGLAAGVMTQAIQRAHQIAPKLQAGIVWINNWNTCPVTMPFGPYKQSGFGKEYGMEAIAEYSQVKAIYMKLQNIRDSQF
jgi:betaine-aldehyde dehydrogenase